MTTGQLNRIKSFSESTIHHNICINYDHINASAINVEEAGGYAVLAGRKGLYLIDLESPYSPSRTLHHQSQWDVGVVKCNPHHQYRGVIASTSNHSALIWNVGLDGNAAKPLLATLRAHTRPVSDLSWSTLDPFVLATCSADGCTHIWDIRTPSKPVQTLKSFASNATQVEWNRFDQSSLATAHDGDVRIWDTRLAEKSSVALITAHMQGIYGLDWNPSRMYELMTCSEDATVKIWDVTMPRTCQGTLKTGTPVRRAKYTPFGDGIVTVAHRLDNAIILWSLTHANTGGPTSTAANSVTIPLNPVPTGGSSSSTNSIFFEQVHVFTGHTDVVKGFDWRQLDADTYQLISWSKRQQLRMWKIEPKLLESCGHLLKTVQYPTQHVNEETKAGERTTFPNYLKYDLSYLKNDFAPLKPPHGAKQISAEIINSNAYLERNGDDLAMSQSDIHDLRRDYEATNFDIESDQNKDGLRDDASGLAATIERSLRGPSSKPLPCPRISGACFNSANILVVFNSCTAIGQQLNQESKYVPPLPKTYAGLLEMKKRAGRTGVVEDASSYSMLNQATSRFGYPNSPQPFFLKNRTDLLHTSRLSPMLSPQNFEDSPEYEDGDSVHSASNYLSAYFDSESHNLPINDPNHKTTSEHSESRGVQRTFTIGVMMLDISKFCASDMSLGFCYNYSLNTPIVAVQAKPFYVNTNDQDEIESSGLISRTLSETELRQALSRLKLSPIADIPPPVSSKLFKRSCSSSDLDILRVPISRTPEIKHRVTKVANQSIAEPVENCVEDVCRHNADIAQALGADEVARVWNVLGAACNVEVLAPKTQLPSNHLHPWTHHPFGRPLVDSILQIQEQEGDVQSLASIVCVIDHGLRRNLRSTHESRVPRPPLKSSFDDTILEKSKSIRGYATSSSPDIAKDFPQPKSENIENPLPMGKKSSSYVDLSKIGSSLKTWSGNTSSQVSRKGINSGMYVLKGRISFTRAKTLIDLNRHQVAVLHHRRQLLQMVQCHCI